jgi:energy-coupling factor transporter ATP-binding protein EcfA2
VPGTSRSPASRSTRPTCTRSAGASGSCSRTPAGHVDRSPLHLSGGQRRRVALATVLACDPEILVLDEPSANLEPVARRELAEVLLSLGRTMLMVTHDLPYALQLCPRSVLIDDGVVVADGPTRELLADADLLAAHRLEIPYGFRLDSV